MWKFLLNFVLSGWLKLLIVILATKWAVILTNCKWAVVNSIRIQKMGCILLQIANGLYVLCHILVGLLIWRVHKALSTYSQHTILVVVVVGCPSNGCRASFSISDILVSTAQTTVGGTACNRLPMTKWKWLLVGTWAISSQCVGACWEKNARSCITHVIWFSHSWIRLWWLSWQLQVVQEPAWRGSCSLCWSEQ